MGTRSILRAAVIAAMIFSWVAVSNHCALAALSAPTRASESCPMHPRSTPQKEQPGLICCKILRAQPAPAMVKAAAPQVLLLAVGFDFPSAIVRHAGQLEPAVLTPDTGPPPLFSFAETVLHRSLRAHAPPSLG